MLSMGLASWSLFLMALSRRARLARGLVARFCGPRFEARVTSEAYTKTVDTWKNPNEDERGVDVGQIRDMLSMSIAERAHEMVRVANLMAKARETAHEARLETR